MKNPEDCKSLDHSECYELGLHDIHPDRHTLGISPACIACEQAISTGEFVLAFLSNQDATAYHGHTLTFPVPPEMTGFPSDTGWSITGDGTYFIKKPYPTENTYDIREAFSLHYDCFRLFKKSCVSENALSGLWTMASWKNPWRRAPPPDPFLNPIETKVDWKSLSSVAEKCGIQNLAKLPFELVAIIRDLSDSAIFWRYVYVLGIAKEVATRTQSGSIVRMPLSQISFWERDSIAVQKEHPVMATRLRFSIDQRGIRRIERLKDSSDAGGDTTDCTEFILEDESALQGILAEFKDGLLRLVLPSNIPFLRIWDIPCPPAFDGRQFYFEKLVRQERLHAISLERKTSVTFYRQLGYAPIQRESSELSRLLSKYTHHPPLNLWFYMPISQGETIQRLIIRSSGRLGCKRFQFSIITSRNRVYNIGPWLGNRAKIVKIMKGPAKTLVWGETDYTADGNWTFTGHMSSIGIYDASIEFENTEEGLHPPKDLVPAQPLTCPLREGSGNNHRVYYGRASLDNVSRVRIFQDKYSSQCRGLLFEYDDGSQQAVGLCEFKVFHEKVIVSPLWLFHQPIEDSHYHEMSCHKDNYSGVRVEFTTEKDPSAERAGWITERMAGMLTFWFSVDSSAVVVESPSAA